MKILRPLDGAGLRIDPNPGVHLLFGKVLACFLVFARGDSDKDGDRRLKRVQ